MCDTNQLSNIEAFWQSYRSTLSEEEQKTLPAYAVDQFADTPEAATKVGKLVRDGYKTTTSSLVWGLEAIGVPLPKIGTIELIIDGNGEPLCIIELTEVEIKPYCSRPLRTQERSLFESIFQRARGSSMPTR